MRPQSFIGGAIREACANDLPSPSLRSTRHQIRTFALRLAFHHARGVVELRVHNPGKHSSIESDSTKLTESSQMQQTDGIWELSVSFVLSESSQMQQTDGRKGERVPVQTTQTQREVGAVLVRRRVAHSATRAKLCIKRP